MQNMTFAIEALRDSPQVFIPMGPSSPYPDVSGYGRNLTNLNGTPSVHSGLITGVPTSGVFSSTITGRFNSPLFVRGREKETFTLEAVVKVINPTFDEQQIVGNFNTFDGITITNNTVKFSTTYVNTGPAEVYFDLQQNRRAHIVAVHTADKNSLYVNGQLVGEISITEAQQADTYSGPSGTLLYVGTTYGSQETAIAGLGVYSSAFTQDTVTRHYVSGINVVRPDEISGVFKGKVFPVAVNNANVFSDQWWRTEQDWTNASLNNVAVVNSRLVPQLDENNFSVPGQWLDSFALDAADTTSIYGVSMNWDGVGVGVEASLDGVTWEVAKRGINLSIIPSGFNPTNKELQIRLSFQGGIFQDSSFIDNLNAVGIKTATAPTPNGRTLSYNLAHPERDYSQLEYHENWGVEISPGGSLTISSETSGEQSPLGTLELWVKANSSSQNANFGLSGTRYINGAADSGNLPVGKWVVYHLVLASASTAPLQLTGPLQIGHIAFYDYALNASQVNDIFLSQTASKKVALLDSDTIPITEVLPNIKIYGFDWVIKKSG